MSIDPSRLDFTTLRVANVLRLPQFKNKHGVVSHSMRDGSDWTPAQWIQATVGEIGEMCEARVAFENGFIDFERFKSEAKSELPDATIYWDIAARRMLDRTMADEPTPAGTLMRLMHALGTYANARKKYERGDITREELLASSAEHLTRAMQLLVKLMDPRLQSVNYKVAHYVLEAHPEGVDLGQAVIDKFNKVSDRVGSTVKIDWRGAEVVLNDKSE